MEAWWCCSGASGVAVAACWQPPRSSSHTRRPSPRIIPTLPRLLIRNAAAEDTPPDPQPGTALYPPSPSLLTLSNINKALCGEDLITPDHYATLGLPRGASYEEVRRAFRERFERVVQQGTDEDAIREKLRILKDSYEVLSSEEQRRLYDWSLLHSESLDGKYRWPYEADITQRTSGPGPPKAPEDEEAIRRVGYFFLGWFILSCILSLVLK